MFRLLVPILVVMLALAPACSKPSISNKTSAQPGATSHSTSSPKANPPAAKTQKPAADKKAPLRLGAELLSNPSFELWENNLPLDWEITEGHGKSWQTTKLSKLAGAQEGTAAAELPEPQGENMVLVAQNLDSAKVKRGRNILVRATVKASAKDQLHIVLNYKAGGKIIKKRVCASGKEGWETLQGRFWIPPDTDPKSLRLVIFRHTKGPGQVLVDSVSVKFIA